MKQPITIKNNSIILRTKTNGGDLCKQDFSIHYSTTKKELLPSLVIRKLVLTKTVSLYYKDYVCLKHFKDWYLFEQEFGIKVKTLQSALRLLDEVTPIEIE